MGSFTQAKKTQARLRLALVGSSGSGKTRGALEVATRFSDKVAVIDTEHGSASLYSDRFRFDTCQLVTFDPNLFVEKIHEAEEAGYGAIVIDSLSHAWMGKDGALEQVDRLASRSSNNSSYFAWNSVTPKHMALVNAILQSPAHVIATIRAKTEYVLNPGKNGKIVPEKVGLAPVQRDGLEYEFGVVGYFDEAHAFRVTKSRCDLLEGRTFAADEFPEAVAILQKWLADGEPTPTREEIKAKIEACTTLAELDALVPTIALQSDRDRDYLRPCYAARKGDFEAP
jgi:AAA domain